MRVISGTARGRKLKEPIGEAIRPTTDMVKESIFNIIQFDIEGRRVLDLFSGTGQLGIEALSRGAADAVFVDESNDAVRLIQENIKNVGLEERAHVVRGEGISFLRRGDRFDVIFLDPPYDSGLLERAIATIIEFDILKENGIMVCETKSDKTLPEVAFPYKKGREYKYGKIKVALYSKNSQSDASV